MDTNQESADRSVSPSRDLFTSARQVADKLGNQLIDAFVLIALFVFGGTIIWSAVHSYLGLIEQGYGTISDILLLFIYLELGVMIGIYFKSGSIPAQFLIFIAITVLTRMLASVTVVEMTDQRILVIVGTILLLSVAVLILRVADTKFGPQKKESWLS